MRIGIQILARVAFEGILCLFVGLTAYLMVIADSPMVRFIFLAAPFLILFVIGSRQRWYENIEWMRGRLERIEEIRAYYKMGAGSNR